MRVALDVHALQVEGWADRGVGRYVAGYSAALARRGVLAAALLAPELPPPSGLPNMLSSDGLARWDTATACRELLAAGGGVGGSASPPLVYHLTAPFLHCEPGAPAALGVVEHWARAPVARAVLLHDLIPLRAPRHYLAGPGHEERYRSRSEWVGAADLVLTNSEHTRQEAVSLLGCDPSRVVTVGAGVSSFFSPPDGTDNELWRFHFGNLAGRPHLLTVGGSDVRKGTDRAIVALSLLVARGLDLHLLVLGHLTPAWRSDLDYTARAAGVADRVTFGGAVSDELLRACYRRAILSLMPSLAEGAGLPVLESAACGTPALASATSALGETAATPTAVFDPTQVDSIADAVAAAVESDERRAAILSAQQAVAAASTWDAVAARAVAAIEGLGAVGVGAVGVGAGLGPPRLALVGWPAAEIDLLERVVEAWDGVVDVVSAEPTAGLDPGPAGVVDGAAFGPDVRPASYDAVVYVLSGGAGDGWVLSVAGRYPGWLWLRGGSVRLGGGCWLEPLVRRSCGILVDDGGELAEAVRLALRPLAAPPPIVMVPSGREGPALTGALRPPSGG